MKKFQSLILVPFLLMLIWSGCKEEEGPVLPPNLIVTSTKGHIVDRGTQILFTANMDVRWIAADSAGGEFDENGLYTAPNRDGTFLLTAVSTEDITVTKSMELYVTQYADHFNDLLNGSQVVYFRHAIADSGVDIPANGGEWFRSCSADSARQLALRGIDQAIQTGEVLWKMGMPINRMISSEFCRCIQSAEHMNQGGVEITTDTALTFLVYDEFIRHERTEALINSLDVPEGQFILLNSHSFGPGFAPIPQLNMGDAAIFIPNKTGGRPVHVTNIPAKGFTDLYRE